MIGIVVDTLGSQDVAGFASDRAAGVGIAVEAWEIATGDLEPDPVAYLNTLLVAPRSMRYS
jgi:hypothetical protein